MTIVLPIFFAAVGFGLFAGRMTRRHWVALSAIIALVILYNYVKPLKPPATSGGAGNMGGGGAASSNASGG